MRLLSLWAFGLLRQCRSVLGKLQTRRFLGGVVRTRNGRHTLYLWLRWSLGLKFSNTVSFMTYFLLIIEILSWEVKTFKQTCLHLLECFFQVSGSLGSSQFLCIPAVVLHTLKILCIYFSVCAHCLGIFYVYTIFGNWRLGNVKSHDLKIIP